jgi:hypothetical protein
MSLMERSRRRIWTAVAGALLLHGLLLLGLCLLPRVKPAPRRRSEPLQVELRKLERPATAPPAGAAPADQPAPALPKATGQRRSPSSLPAFPPAALPDGVRAPDGLANRSPAAPGEGAGHSGQGLSLQLENPEGALPGRYPPPGDSGGLVREKTREEKLADEKALVGRRLEGWGPDIKARERARLGRDAYWQPVENTLAHGFAPGWDVIEQDGRNAVLSALGAYLQGWQKQAEAYARTGNPFARLPDPPGAVTPLNQDFIGLANSDRGLDSVSLGGVQQPLAMTLAAGAVSGSNFSHQLVTLVRITLREDGSLFAVQLAGTSGNRAYDELALVKARSLDKLHLGPAPLGRETLWAFETDFTESPPVPLAGCALDDFVPTHCWHPLQKLKHSRVRLVAIY